MEKEKLLEVIKLLLKKYVEETGIIQFDPHFIESILFTINEDGTKTINKEIFYLLRANQIDMQGVSFENTHITGYYFNGLKNVEINIQKIPNYDISKTYLEGVKLMGTLDGTNIQETKFKGYIGELILDPQKVQNKDLYFTDLSGLTVNGSFDDTRISMAIFDGAKGKIRINPQKIQNKDLSQVKLAGVELVGDYDKETGQYNDPCFDDCILGNTDFTGHMGNVIINPQTIKNKNLSLCNMKGVTFNGSFDDTSIYATSFRGSTGAKIDLDKVKLYGNLTNLTHTEIFNSRKTKKKRILSPRKKPNL